MHNEKIVANIGGNITEYIILKDIFSLAKGLKAWQIVSIENGKHKRPLIFKYLHFATPEEALICVCMYLTKKRYTYKIEKMKGEN